VSVANGGGLTAVRVSRVMAEPPTIDSLHLDLLHNILRVTEFTLLENVSLMP